jgi:aminoglycoside 6-adenylyltransferase
MTDPVSTSEADRLLERIVQWGRAEPAVLGLALTGSRAGPDPPDDLADLDVQVFAAAGAALDAREDWLAALGPVWVQVRDEYRDGGERVPTRLVVFAGGVKVDFAFYDAGKRFATAAGGPSVRALLDKPPHAEEPTLRPRSHERGQAAFTALIEEFWFEAYHVGKYLARADLWPARSRHEAILERLLTMIEWHHESAHGTPPPGAGKRLASWAPAFVGESLGRLYARPDVEGSWTALWEAIALFRRLARETAAARGLQYAERVDRDLAGFLETLHDLANRSAATND